MGELDVLHYDYCGSFTGSYFSRLKTLAGGWHGGAADWSEMEEEKVVGGVRILTQSSPD